MLEAGSIIAGRYQVDRVLGQGGMGQVWSGVHVQLQQPVAIKILLPQALGIPEAVQRFLREARSAVRLRSEHVGKVLDVGQLDDGAPYMVMELLQGGDLSSVLHARGSLPVAIVVDYVLQASEGLAEAHALGVVHRDLKPANLFLTTRPDGSPLVKVLDFGIAKAAVGDVDQNLTGTTAIMGSPGYMSPEQLRASRDVDARSDLWSLGIVLYELTSGAPPFHGDTFTALCLNIATEPHTPLSGVPAEFAAVVDRCLAKQTSDRFQNVAELAAALAPFASNTSGADAASRIARVLKVPVSAGAFPPAPGQPSTLGGSSGQVMPAAVLATGARTPRSRAPLYAGSVIVAIGITIAVALVVTRPGDRSDDVTTTAVQESRGHKIALPDAASDTRIPDALPVESKTGIPSPPEIDREGALAAARSNRKKDPRAAIAETQSLVDASPGDPEVRVLRAELYFVAGDSGAALDEILAADDPRSVDTKPLHPFLRKLAAAKPKDRKVKQVIALLQIKIEKPAATKKATEEEGDAFSIY